MALYLQYGDIAGDVTEDAHVDWIELLSAHLGSFRHDRGKPTGHSVHEIVVTKSTDRSSSALFRESITGSPVAATIDFVADDGHVYLTFRLTDALISSFVVSGHGSNPTESLTLNFTKITYVNG